MTYVSQARVLGKMIGTLIIARHFGRCLRQEIASISTGQVAIEAISDQHVKPLRLNIDEDQREGRESAVKPRFRMLRNGLTHDW